jgi:hypothetical protein
MLSIKDIDPKDYKYIQKTPDRSFNPARNKAIIDQTIKDTETYFKDINGLFNDSIHDRIEAVSAYGAYRFNRGDKSIKDYLGKKLYENLIGEKILSKLRVMESVNKLNNNKKYKNTILL